MALTELTDLEHWVVYFFKVHGVILEMMFCTFLFTLHQFGRRHYLLKFFGMAPIMFVISFLLTPTLYPPVLIGLLKYALCMGIIFLFVRSLDCTSIPNALFTCVSIILCQHMAFKVGDLAIYPISENYLLADFVYVVSVFCVYALVYELVCKRVKLEDTSLTYRPFNLILYLCVTAFVFVFQRIFYQHRGEVSFTLYCTYSLLDLTCCIFALYNQYSIAHSNRLEVDKRLMEHILHKQEEQYQKAKDSMELFHMKYHDLKNQLASHASLTAEERHQIYESLNFYDAPARTGNETLDIILAEKNIVCRQNNIRLECIADGSCLQSIYPVDAYSMFGNALDNALESTQKIEDVSRRYISISIRRAIGFDVFHIENPYTGELRFRDELPLTTKGDEQYHGYGMRSIQYVVKKYGGYLTITTENQVFSLNIIIPAGQENNE